MNSTDINVLQQLRDWLNHESPVWLVTVVKTYGSSPRQPGAILALRADGTLVGSVSGGCIEDDLVDKVRSGKLSRHRASLMTYGASAQEQERFRLPCGGSLELLIEPLADYHWLDSVLKHIGQQQLIKRRINLSDSRSQLVNASGREPHVVFEKDAISMTYGPRWRMLIIGAGETSVYLTQMAQSLDYQVFVCEPRDYMQAGWSIDDVPLLNMMPDDAVTYLQPDVNTVVIALTHDPKLDDLALLEALKSAAFYVGALGSRANNMKRRERLALFDLSDEEIDRLHGPVGLPIASKTPAEIAVAILAELIAQRNQLLSPATNKTKAETVGYL